MLDLQDRIIGCIVGGAIGDYWGMPYEGAVGPIEAPFPSVSIISDDTQLTLATCEAIVESGTVTPEAVAQGLTRWFCAGKVTGIGSSTLKALRDLALGAPWTISGASGERSAGNGAAMRIAPVAFCCDPLSDAGRHLIRDICWITHRHDEAYVGALAVAAAIARPGRDSLGTLVGELPDSNCRDRLAALVETGEHLAIAALGTKFGVSGYVADSVPLAIYAARRVGKLGFREVLGSVIACGGDTDTMGAITGQIAGAALGRKGLPGDLVDRVPGIDAIAETAEGFARTVRQMR
ncbi:MAG: hypothetical protein A3K19_03005 [Lentisphaerae bacterium RIFOXYB12_FULL_65_16]|nr:MAG: hypothetical protein A3K18_13170 [Lentisphaerae bacterium RIFOXYA12_64_32]OGV92320.1 MAG: hypothetical protein A3K19_03005 [Lentisphaerae bacterium RIFOXYB12_FULL_65_16]